MSVKAIIKEFPRTFWVGNTLELIERWAWYGFFMLFANYMTRSSDLGGLQFTQIEKGYIMGIGTGILYFLPVITGAIADKYGYKRVLYLAFTVYTTAFIFLPMFHSFTGVFIMYLYLALGAALFKPIVSATVAKTTNDRTASIGFGIFYMMVNLGAFFGPMLTLLYSNSSYSMVFHISAGMIALNFLILFFYKEPDRVPSKESLSQSILGVFKNIGLVFKDLRFVLFLVIVAGFWTMYNQLFFTLPVFIAQWIDTAKLYHFFSGILPFIATNYSHHGQMDPEFITNLDALSIIIFQIIVSSVVMRWRPLGTMVTGFIVSSVGMSLSLLTQNISYTIIAIFIFSIGEMTASPKITEYIGRIAPPDKKALYMGYSFIPVFLGNIFAGFISGNVYQSMSDKHTLLVKEVMKRGIQMPKGLTLQQYFDQAAQAMHMKPEQLTNYLWKTYHPSSIWTVILAIGLAAALMLWIYDKYILNRVSHT
ncbi:MAG: MFS transporter [Bacteroidales bacterium]|nr:MFS transporter [Bacteroidales bacterium]